MAFELLFLGTGTSTGVPMIGCGCAVCASTDPRDKRRRSAAYVRAGGRGILIDTPPDLREQALSFGVREVDAVLVTHSHADHLMGFDDIRRFNTINGGVLPIYALPQVLEEIRRVFHYVGGTPVAGLYRPLAEFRGVTGPFEIGEAVVTPVPVTHGSGAVCGFRIDCEGRSLGYVPDCNELPEPAFALLEGLDVMVLDALRDRPHATHFTIEQSLAALARVNAGRSYLVHMCHDLSHEALQSRLPPNTFASHDGLRVTL